MKRIREILDTLITLVAAGKVIWPWLLIIASGVLAIWRFGNRKVLLPIWLVVLASAIFIYVVAWFLLRLMGRRQHPFRLYGLLWRQPLLPFRFPVPLCPREGCGREVICKQVPPPSLQLVRSLSEWKSLDLQPHYIYECPIHGEISGVPDEDIELLQRKAKLAMKR